MNLTTLMAIGENINESSTMAERASVGVQVVLIGMGVVFGVLLILIGILQLFKLFAVKGTAKPVASAPAATPAPTPAPAAHVQQAAPASEDEAIVAIASAAIAAARGESECAFNILSIKKIVK